MVSDRGPQFSAVFLEQLSDPMGMGRKLSMSFHPQTDRQIEQINARIQQYLCIFVNYQQEDLARWLALAEFAANCETLETMKCSPFFAVSGIDPCMTFEGQEEESQDQRKLDTDQVQATMLQVHEHLQVEIR
jgi:hypothetical protein